MMTGPVKAIHSYTDHETFKKSPAYHDLLDFVKKCAEAAVGTHNTNDSAIAQHAAILSFTDLMDRLFNLVDEVPPIKQPMRFGNKAFRAWHGKMVELSKECANKLEAETGEVGLADEVVPYIAEMFGNPTRIDYGTGHELNFAVYFFILTKLGVLPDDKETLGVVLTKAFVSYIRTMRRLQTDYMLEPAGSHGVWGLDDYHCLLFLWGAAQLSGQKEVRPGDIHDPDLLKEYAPEYLYFEGIQFIKRIKSSAPFAETSPMLNDISGMGDWAKICAGLMRLFQGEVLGKFPVIQHLLFGRVLKATWGAGAVGEGAHAPASVDSTTTSHPMVFHAGVSAAGSSVGSAGGVASVSVTPSRAAAVLAAESTDPHDAPDSRAGQELK